VSRLLRAGGRGTTPAGRSVIWSVAEGGKGRRYREVRRAGEGIAHSLLLETDPDGRFSHLELSTPSGLLTLHPERDGTLHGHAIVSDGIEHVAGLDWEPDGLIAIEDSVVCAMAAAHLLRPTLAAGSSLASHAAWIPPTLWVEIRPVRVGRAAGGAWQLGSGGAIEIDPTGLPLLAGGEVWPLDQVDDGSDDPHRHAVPPG
jgi:hypothetical protein